MHHEHPGGPAPPPRTKTHSRGCRLLSPTSHLSNARSATPIIATSGGGGKDPFSTLHAPSSSRNR
eukprot:14060344-Alexandrium_andersonii.AAC.1